MLLSFPVKVSEPLELTEMISLRIPLVIKPNTMAESHFSCAFTDGYTIKHFTTFLESIDVHTIYFTVTDAGLTVSQVNKGGEEPDVYLHWEIKREDLIMFKFDSPEPIQFGILRKDLSAKMKGISKDAAVGFEKLSGKKTLIINIGPKLDKPSADHFGSSVQIPLVNTTKESYEVPEMPDEDGEVPITAVTVSYLGFILNPVVQPHLVKKASENAALVDRFKMSVYPSAVLIKDSMYEGDGLVFGELGRNDTPITSYYPRIWNLSKMNVLARGCAPHTLVRFYAQEGAPLMLKISLGTFSTLRLFFLPDDEESSES